MSSAITYTNRLLFLLLALGAVLFTFGSAIFFPSAVINMESDNVFYDALLVAQGFVPFRDFFTREPVPLYFFAAQIKLFGLQFAMLEYSLLFIKVCALFLGAVVSFIIARKKSVALLTLVGLGILDVRPLSDFFLFAALLFFLLWRERHRLGFLFASGVSIGLSTLSYRAAIVWCFVLIFFIAFEKNPRGMRTQMSFIMGLLSTLVLPVLIFIFLTDWRWMATIFIADQLLIGTAVAIGMGFLLPSIMRYLRARPQFLRLMLLGGAVVFAVLFFYRPKPPLAVKIAVVHDFARIGLWVVIPFFIFLLHAGQKIFSQWRREWRLLAGGFMTTSIAIILLGTFHTSRGPSLAFRPIGQIIFFLVFCGSVAAFGAAALRTWKKLYIPTSHYLFLVLPVFAMLAAMFTYKDWLPSYFGNIQFPIVVGASIMLVALWETRDMVVRWTVICGTSLGIIATSFIFPYLTASQSGFNPSIEMRREKAEAAVDYLRATTLPTDEIFTAIPYFALRAQRPLTLPLTHPVVYRNSVDDPMPYDPYGLIPSIPEIIEHLETRHVSIIVQDIRTKSLFRTDRHPALQQYINEHYHRVAKFGNIKILRRIYYAQVTP